MVLRAAFVMGRNRGGRPTLMHRLVDGTKNLTACGHDVSSWSRWYTNVPVHELLCRQLACYGSATR